MTPQIISKIFEPFFTTKGKGKGTGLGLAMIYNIIKQNNGFLDVYSEVGIGSTFNIYLPYDKQNEIQTEVRKEVNIIKGKGLILIIDDEEIVREMADVILQECGYKTILAKNGIEGIDIYLKHYKKIKAVILDMIMPVRSGKETFLELKKINPAVKVILTSGFLQNERINSILELGVKDFIHKPYSLEILSKKVHEVINS